MNPTMPLSLRFVMLIAVLLAACAPTSDEANNNAAAPADLPTLPAVNLELMADGFTAPLALVSPNDGSGRLFIADQTGLIYILGNDGQLQSTPFLDLGERMVQLGSRYDERGLLGLDFHPDFAQNGRFFVYYSAPARAEAPPRWDHTAHLSEFRVAADNPDRADPNSERIILQVDQPQANHNGGQVSFGPDGYLYLGLGDGGAANDEGLGHPAIGNGRDRSNWLGTILRLDVDSAEPYVIPPDNPFINEPDVRPEIYAYGLRNPYRFSFDPGRDGALFVADVGQNAWEEVNLVTSGGHYGWNIKEATHCFRPANDCPDTDTGDVPLLDPILEYSHSEGVSVTGGYVYRGQAIPDLVGHYVFSDWRGKGNQPNLFVGSEVAANRWGMQPLTVQNNVGSRNVLAFGQDDAGELYVLTSERIGPGGETGAVFKLVPADSAHLQN